MTPDEVEGLLRACPGVREVAVVFQDGDAATQKPTAYVVPEIRYLETLRSMFGDEPKSLQKWRKTFDLMQTTKEAAAAPQAFNIAGWNSSYTRQPISSEEMREWIEETVNSIQALKPEEILEIGCGTGLLLLRLAPYCERYVGTDFSAAALKRVEEQLTRCDAWHGSVNLLERAADDFEGFKRESFDTLILNSVVQYFPSANYLARVLESAISVVKRGGRIFVGDVLSLPLLEAYSASVELFQSPASTSLWQVREKVLSRMKQQPHLVISPVFFLALQKRHAQISRVEIRPKRGHFDNELSRFRFDAIIFLGGDAEPAEQLEWLDWPAAGFDAARLRKELETRDHRPLALRSVPNGRVGRDAAAAKAITSAVQGRGFVEDLSVIPDDPEVIRLHPSALFALAQELDFDLDWSWAAARNDGSFDLLFRRRTSGQRAAARVAWPQPYVDTDNSVCHTNLPGQAALENKLRQQLLDYCLERLPPSLVPEVVLLDSIPATSSSAWRKNTSVAPSALS